MTVMQMVFEDRLAHPKDPNIEVLSPSETDIEAAILSLDGRKNTMVVLVIEGKSTLTIGGGDNGWSVVDLTIGDNEQFLTLSSLVHSTDEMDLVIGGQMVPYEKKYIVDLPTALEVCKDWVINDGDIPMNHSWVDASLT